MRPVDEKDLGELKKAQGGFLADRNPHFLRGENSAQGAQPPREFVYN